MAAARPNLLADPSSRALLGRLWREDLRLHRRGIVLAMLCTLALSAITALYPIIIQQAFDRFARNDPGVVWLLPPVIIAVTVMLLAADPLANFINNNPTVVMLALGFLLMIGTVLIAEGFGAHVPKGYIYTAMAFSAGVEGLNMLARKRGEKKEG